MTAIDSSSSEILTKHTEIQGSDNGPSDVPSDPEFASKLVGGKRFHDGGYVGGKPGDNKPIEMVMQAPRRITDPRAFTSVPAAAGFDVKGYEQLRDVLLGAYNQAARGKGKERHGNDLPFHEQPIMQIAKMSGIGGHVYQIMKKAQEAGNMVGRGDLDAAMHEFRGVINYAAAAILLAEEIRQKNEQ